MNLEPYLFVFAIDGNGNRRQCGRMPTEDESTQANQLEEVALAIAQAEPGDIAEPAGQALALHGVTWEQLQSLAAGWLAKKKMLECQHRHALPIILTYGVGEVTKGRMHGGWRCLDCGFESRRAEMFDHNPGMPPVPAPRDPLDMRMTELEKSFGTIADLFERSSKQLGEALERLAISTTPKEADRLQANMTGACRCFEIMADDPTRHFRGCPLREKYPTHEAEKSTLEVPPWLGDLISILGWKGGTIHDALREVRKRSDDGAKAQMALEEFEKNTIPPIFEIAKRLDIAIPEEISVRWFAEACEKRIREYERTITQLGNDRAEAVKKWNDYEAKWILPLFTYATEIGIDLQKLVSERAGKTSSVIFAEECVRTIHDQATTIAHLARNPAVPEMAPASPSPSVLEKSERLALSPSSSPAAAAAMAGARAALVATGNAPAPSRFHEVTLWLRGGTSLTVSPAKGEWEWLWNLYNDSREKPALMQLLIGPIENADPHEGPHAWEAVKEWKTKLTEGKKVLSRMRVYKDDGVPPGFGLVFGMPRNVGGTTGEHKVVTFGVRHLTFNVEDGQGFALPGFTPTPTKTEADPLSVELVDEHDELLKRNAAEGRRGCQHDSIVVDTNDATKATCTDCGARIEIGG